MRCEEVMTRDLVTCSMRDSAARCAQLMRGLGIGFLPVTTGKGELVGVITDRDLALRVVADGLDPFRTYASSIMSRRVLTCSPHDSLDAVEDLMRRCRKSRVVCVDHWGHPVGVISLSDIAQADWTWRTGGVYRDIARRESVRAG